MEQKRSYSESVVLFFIEQSKTANDRESHFGLGYQKLSMESEGDHPGIGKKSTMSSTPFLASAMLVVLITLSWSQPGKAAPTLADADPERAAGGKRQAAPYNKEGLIQAVAGYVGKQDAKESALASIVEGIAKDVKSLVHINKEMYKEMASGGSNGQKKCAEKDENCRSDSCCDGLWCKEVGRMLRCGYPPEMTLIAPRVLGRQGN